MNNRIELAHWFFFLSQLYKLPMPIYRAMWGFHAFEVKTVWQGQIMWFHLKQQGVKRFSRRVIGYVKRKFRK